MTDFNKDLDFDVVLDSNRAKQQKLTSSQGADQIVKNYSSQDNDIRNANKSDNNDFSLNAQSYDLNKAGNPLVCVLTFAFKLAAVITYFIVGLFLSNILTFIIVVILSSVDFWIVKNISGRLLVGLRWRSVHDENGKEEWKFESYDEKFIPNKVDKLFFWSSQALFTVIWTVFLFLNILTLDVFWSLLLFITCGLCATNLYGFYQCRGDHQKKLKNLQKQYGSKVVQSIARKVL